jgi:superfamily II DNA helicase RecQ
MATPSTPPKGTQHRQRKRRTAAKVFKDLPERRPLTPNEMEGLDKLIKEQFGWENGPQKFQMQGIEGQLQGLDVMVHAGTGSGKTGIAAGPHVHPSSKGKVTIMVSPLLALHDEQVSINKKPI